MLVTHSSLPIGKSIMSEKSIKVGVLCIQGAFIEHIRMLQRVAETRTGSCKISVVDVRKPFQLLDLDGLIIPGGESTTLSVFLKNNDFEETLKSWVFDEKNPGVVWGTCAGLIMLSDEVTGQKQGGQITVSVRHTINILSSPGLSLILKPINVPTTWGWVRIYIAMFHFWPSFVIFQITSSSLPEFDIATLHNEVRHYPTYKLGYSLRLHHSFVLYLF